MGDAENDDGSQPLTDDEKATLRQESQNAMASFRAARATHKETSGPGKDARMGEIAKPQPK